MATLEGLVLDGLQLNDNTTFRLTELQCPPPRQRQDWIGAADSEAQLLFRNPLHENRQVTASIQVVQQASMDLAQDKGALLIDKLAKASKYTDGIGLTWTPAGSTRTVTFDALAGEITDLPVDWENGWFSLAPTFTVVLTCKPYWRGTETLTGTTSSSTPFVVAEIVNNSGDIPALGRLIITDTATQSRRHVEWGLEGPLTYNSATSLLIDSDNMVTSGFSGAQAAAAGAYDPNASGNNLITGTAYGPSPTALCGTGVLSHIGAFRVKGRLGAAVPAIAQFRFSWRAADGPMSSNAWVGMPGSATAADWCEFDLGMITIPAVLSGTQAWQGQIEVKTSGDNSQVSVDYLTLVPVSDGYGKARAVYRYQPGVLVGRDSFTGTTAGAALNARTAEAGGTWATSGGTTDYAFADDLSNEQVKRSTVSDTGVRFAILGASTFTNTQVEMLSQRTADPATSSSSVVQGVIARWIDSSNYLTGVVEAAKGPAISGSVPSWTLRVTQVVAGAITDIATASFRTGSSPFVIRLIAYDSGTVIMTLLNTAKTAELTAPVQGQSTALATGGALASGKPGIYDVNTATTSISRYYDDFQVSIPPAEPIVIYSGRNMQIRHDDTIRQDSTGTYTGRPQSYLGSRFLVGVGTSRVLVKARRNDVDTAADNNVTDATQIQIGVTPRGLAIPRS